MYRIVLLAKGAEFEAKIDHLLHERLRGRYLMKTIDEPEEFVPRINGSEPNVILAVLPVVESEVSAFLRRVLEFAGHIPVIAVVEKAEEELEVSVLQEGAKDCLIMSELTARALARVIRNAVERARVEDKLAREQEMLGSLLSKLPDRIYFKDRESRFLRVNDAMAKLFHLRDAAAAIGRSDSEFFPPEDAHAMQADEQRIISTGEPIIDKLEGKQLPGGGMGWTLTSKLPLRDKTGEIIGTFGISHDVTVMKRLEQAVEAERMRLQQLTEELRTKNIQLEQDLVMAKGIQEALLPERKYIFPAQVLHGRARIECSSVYRPAEAVGGDFFSVIPISDTQVGVLICDIMGHGLRAALGTAIVRGLIEELREHAARPDDFFTNLNRALRAILRNIDEPLLVTACYLVADAGSDEVLFSSAGHPMPLILDRESRKVSSISERRRAHGPALALFDDAVYEMERVRLAPSEVALLFTDGVTEMSDLDGREIGVERFMAAAGAHAELDAGMLCERVLDEIQLAAGGVAFQDDVCLLAVERRTAERQPS